MTPIDLHTKKAFLETLYQSGATLLVRQKEQLKLFHQRGVADLFHLVQQKALQGTDIADKAVGKAAAFLMVQGGIHSLCTPLISQPAALYLHQAQIDVYAEVEVPFILNRNQSGLCPLEERCQRAKTHAEIDKIIYHFLQEIKAIL